MIKFLNFLEMKMQKSGLRWISLLAVSIKGWYWHREQGIQYFFIDLNRTFKHRHPLFYRRRLRQEK